MEWEIDVEEIPNAESQRLKKLEHSMVILQYSESFLFEDQVTIILAQNESVQLPLLILAALSDTFKEYLKFIDSSTILEPLVIIPDLALEEFNVFKAFLFNQHIQNFEENLEALMKVLNILGVKDFLTKKSHTTNPRKKKEQHVPDKEIVDELPQPKKVPTIISHSSYGRPRKLNKALLEDFETEENLDLNEDTFEDTTFDNDSLDRSFPCPYCSKSLTNMKAKHRHMLSEHVDRCKEDSVFFECSVCKATFVSNLGREKHMNRMHPTKVEVPVNLIICPFDHQSGEIEGFEK